jgi:hypothetical protein
VFKSIGGSSDGYCALLVGLVLILSAPICIVRLFPSSNMQARGLEFDGWLHHRWREGIGLAVWMILYILWQYVLREYQSLFSFDSGIVMA